MGQVQWAFMIIFILYNGPQTVVSLKGLMKYNFLKVNFIEFLLQLIFYRLFHQDSSIFLGHEQQRQNYLRLGVWGKVGNEDLDIS